MQDESQLMYNHTGADSRKNYISRRAALKPVGFFETERQSRDAAYTKREFLKMRGHIIAKLFVFGALHGRDE